MGLVAGGLLWAASIGAGGSYGDYLPADDRHGHRHRPHLGTDHRVDHGFPASGQGRDRLGRQRHRPRGRWCPGRPVLGSVLASQYTSTIDTAGVPGPAAGAAGESLGGAVVAAQHVGGQAGAALLDAARTAWVHGFGVALTVAAAVAAAGATVAAIWLPARAARADPRPPRSEVPRPMSSGGP